MHISPGLTQDYTYMYVDQGLAINFSVLTRTVTICASSLEVEILGSLSVPRWIILILSSPFSRDEIRSCLGSRIPKGYTNPHGIGHSQCAESSPFPRCWSSGSHLSLAQTATTYVCKIARNPCTVYWRIITGRRREHRNTCLYIYPNDIHRLTKENSALFRRLLAVVYPLSLMKS